jgi:hypothetical protein
LAPAYLIYALAIVLMRSRKEAPLVTLATLAYFPLFHCSYALGILSGLLLGRVAREAQAPERAIDLVYGKST